MKIKETLLTQKHFSDQRSYSKDLTLKLLLLCCGFLIVFPFTIQSQNFIPLLGENKSWSCAWEVFDGQESYTIRFEGDTTINGVDYNKIIRDPHFHPFTELIGYIREDSLGRVFSMNTSFEEGLLYDFGANQGDTVVMHNTMMDSWDYDCPFFAELTIVVDSVYTIETQDGVTRRVSAMRRTDDTLQELWIEGIGSLAGVVKSGTKLFEELICPPFLWNYLLCYFEDDSLVYYHTFIDNHDCRHYDDTGIENISGNTVNVKIAPNPVTGSFFHIESRKPVQGEICFYNSLGKPVYKKTVHSPEKNIKVPAGSFPPGIYFLKIPGMNGKTFRAKIIIVNN